MILEQLYDGNIGPAHMHPYETTHSQFYDEQADKLEKALRDKLDDHGQRLLTLLQEAGNASDGALAYGAFVHGFKIATLMMAEVFMDKESELTNPEVYWNAKLRPRDILPID